MKLVTKAEIVIHQRGPNCAENHCKICLALGLIEECSWCGGAGEYDSETCHFCWGHGMDYYTDTTPRTLSDQEIAELIKELNDDELWSNPCPKQ